MESFSASDDDSDDEQADNQNSADYLLRRNVNDSSVTRPKPLKYPKKYLFGIVVASALGSFLWGYHTSVIAGAMLFVDDHFDLSVLWHEVVVSVAIAGAAVGVITAGMMSDRLGRWKVMMTSAVLFGLGSVILSLSFFTSFLVAGRAIVGLASGECIDNMTVLYAVLSQCIWYIVLCYDMVGYIDSVFHNQKYSITQFYSVSRSLGNVLALSSKCFPSVCLN